MAGRILEREGTANVALVCLQVVMFVSTGLVLMLRKRHSPEGGVRLRRRQSAEEQGTSGGCQLPRTGG